MSEPPRAGAAKWSASARAFALGTAVGAFPSRVLRGRRFRFERQHYIEQALPVVDAYLAIDWLRACGNRIRYDLVKLFLDRSGEVIDWLGDLAEGQLTIKPLETYYAGEYYPEHYGTHTISGKFEGNDNGLTAPCYVLWKKAEEQGAQFYFDAPAVQLEKDVNGTVTAAIAQAEVGYVRFVGSEGVILVTGDISGDAGMMAEYADPFCLAVKANFYTPIGANTGDGHKMGMWVGGHMCDVIIPGMIHLNRFARLNSCFICDTLEELADAMQFDETAKQTFLDQVAEYNEMVALGEDTQFGKRPELLFPIEQGPFYALKFGPALLCAPGGLEVDATLHVLDDNGAHIPGLYAVGNVSGGRYAIDYPVFINGNSHGSALTWGYVVAENAVNGI